jgi:hypothetical protein
MRRIIPLVVALTLAAPAAFGQHTPSVKEDFKDAGRSVEHGVEGTYDKAKDATVDGVGTAIEKTGEGLDKAGRKIEGAGTTVKDKAE